MNAPAIRHDTRRGTVMRRLAAGHHDVQLRPAGDAEATIARNCFRSTGFVR